MLMPQVFCSIQFHSCPIIRYGTDAEINCTRLLQVEGGLFQAGDCHTVQGDSEYDGTALETPYTAQFRLTVHKATKLPYFIPTPFEAPILETANEMCWHAFTFNVSSS